jgi:hypothetical protein
LPAILSGSSEAADSRAPPCLLTEAVGVAAGEPAPHRPDVATDLKRVGVHAERGQESVEHLRRLYAGHDLLHLKQIERTRAAVS